MYDNGRVKIKGKLQGEYEDYLCDAIEILRKNYRNDISISQVIPSREGGYHVLFTIYMRNRRPDY